MTDRTLVLGGTRSGKSEYAEGLLNEHDAAVTYVATGKTDQDDAEWQERIAAHVARRPATWRTVEPADPAELAVLLTEAEPEGGQLIVDDIATWLTGALDHTDAWSGTPESRAATAELVDGLIAAVTACRTRLVLVSAEVGLGVVPETSAGRLFRDELGALNTRLAQVCDEVVLIVAGRALSLTEPAPVKPAVRAPEPVVTPTVVEESTYDPALDEDLREPVSPHFPVVTPPDQQVHREAVARHESLTKPSGSLGRLEELGVWIAACQGVCPPHPFARPRVVVFAGDHGIAKHGVSAFPSEVTGQMVANFLGGGAAVNVLASAAGATVRVVDISVDGDTPELVRAHKIRRSSGAIDREDALTNAEVTAALEAGKAIADEEIDSGADVLIAGDMGIGNTTPAAVLIAALTGSEPVAVVGRGTGIDDAAWMRKTVAIRDALRRTKPVLTDPVALLRTAGGADLAAMTGFLAQAAVRRTPVILDGVVVGAAAVVAENLAPGAKKWWVAGHRSVEPAHILALAHLDLDPILDLGMRLGEGSGAVTALPLLAMAVRVLADMATFGDAGVSGREIPLPTS